jgi:hypothetical protein
LPERHVGNIRLVQRPDALDGEIIAEAVRGRFWELICKKADDMILQHQQVLENSPDPRAIAQAQGAVQALRRVKDLPAILRKEAAT